MRRILIALATTAAFLGPSHAQTAETATSEVFVTAHPTDILSYNLVGLNITNNANESIGEIKDLILSNGALAGYIVSVGGILGLGEHYVIVNPKAVQVIYLENDNKWTATMDATKEQLQSAPAFTYDGRWKK